MRSDAISNFPPPCGEGLRVGLASHSMLVVTPTPALPTRGREK